MELLQCLAQLTSETNRLEAAKKTARFLQADDLIIFIMDNQLNVFLPGPGFPQSLPNGKAWSDFLTGHDELIYSGVVPYPTKESQTPAWAIRASDGSVGVLLGGNPTEKERLILQEIVLIVAPLLKQEQIVQTTQSKANYHAQVAAKAERLSKTLDGIRQNLMKVIAENSQLLQLTKQQNDDLAAANEELSAANEAIVEGIDELNDTNNELKRINEDLDNFIYTASHDLKAPISNIEGLMSVLIKKLKVKGWEDDSTKRIAELINTSIERFKETIVDLTEVAKIGKDTQDNEGMVSLTEVINDVLLDLRGKIIDYGVEVEHWIAPEIDLFFNRKNLKSIMFNLIDNAIKYRSPNRQPIIAISLESTSGYQVLTIKDNGLGIDPNKKDKIFGLFKRLHMHVDGTGVGLYIVKKIIENAGGKIEVESKPGVGSSFAIYFKHKS
ncbi:MAG: HAMP domain-containing sensor histidine kinase [Bacteroidota bacterium]